MQISVLEDRLRDDTTLTGKEYLEAQRQLDELRASPLLGQDDGLALHLEQDPWSPEFDNMTDDEIVAELEKGLSPKLRGR